MHVGPRSKNKILNCKMKMLLFWKIQYTVYKSKSNAGFKNVMFEFLFFFSFCSFHFHSSVYFNASLNPVIRVLNMAVTNLGHTKIREEQTFIQSCSIDALFWFQLALGHCLREVFPRFLTSFHSSPVIVLLIRTIIRNCLCDRMSLPGLNR